MKKPSAKMLEKQCADFNKKYPVGTGVMLKKDLLNEPIKTAVREPAYVLNGHSAVAFFKGVTGCYAVECVKGLSVKVLDAEVRASQWLADGNAAKENGNLVKAEKCYAKGQFWLDRYNKLMGRA